MKRSDYRFEDMFQMCIDFIATRGRPNSIRAYRNEQTKLLRWLKNNGIERVGQWKNRESLIKIITDHSYLAPQCIKLMLQFFRRSYTMAVRHRLVTFDPNFIPADLFGIKLNPKLRPRHAITEQEYRKILAFLKSPAGQRHPSWSTRAVTIAWHTGLRVSDIALMKADSVDLVARVLRIEPIKTMRFNKVVEIPMTEELYQCFIGMGTLTPGHWVMPDMAIDLRHNSDAFYHKIQLIMPRAGVKGTFHSLRHGFVTRLLNAGVDPITIGSMTGQSIEMIKRYAHVSYDAKLAALEKATISVSPIGEPGKSYSCEEPIILAANFGGR
jgi:integrase